MNTIHYTTTLKALRNLCEHGIALASQGRYAEALERYKAVVEPPEFSNQLEFLRIVATAMFNSGAMLSKYGYHQEAIKAYDALIGKLDHQTHPQLVVFLVKAMMNKAHILNSFNRNQETVALYQSIVDRFSAYPELDIQTLVNSVFHFLVERLKVIDARKHTLGAYQRQA